MDSVSGKPFVAEERKSPVGKSECDRSCFLSFERSYFPIQLRDGSLTREPVEPALPWLQNVPRRAFAFADRIGSRFVEKLRKVGDGKSQFPSRFLYRCDAGGAILKFLAAGSVKQIACEYCQLGLR